MAACLEEGYLDGSGLTERFQVGGRTGGIIQNVELLRAIQTTGGRLDDMAELLEVSARGIQLRLRDLGVRR